MWLTFHIDLFIGPLDSVRCQSGPLSQLPVSRFFWGRWFFPSRNVMHDNYRSIYQNSMQFYSELNGKCAGDGFIPLRSLRYYLVNLEKMEILRDLIFSLHTFDPIFSFCLPVETLSGPHGTDVRRLNTFIKFTDLLKTVFLLVQWTSRYANNRFF